MKFSSTPIHLLAIAGVAQANTDKIKWGKCKDVKSAGVPIECANLTVPLDYTEKGCDETLELNLLRVRATQKPSKGSIIHNFGGPGVDGRNSLAADAANQLGVTGGHYDLVTFDPRGTGKTLPFTCFDNATDSAAAILENPDIWYNALKRAFTFVESSDTRAGEVWATGKAVADKCHEQHRKYGDLVGTPFAVRDMMQIVDALDEDGMLRYWGGSYGTALGATAAAMFPDRIGAMVLDAVLIPEDYYRGSQESQIKDSDKVFRHFFESCLQSPKFCPLAASNMTAKELEKQYNVLMQDIKYNPRTANGTLISYTMIKGGIINALYSPSKWPIMATGLAYLASGNLTGFTETWAPLQQTTGGDALNMATIGVRCSDRTLRYNSFDKFKKQVAGELGVSKIAGSAHASLDAACAQWKFEAKERFEGSFQVKTKNPVLLIGNTGDFITPLSSARNVSGQLEGSRLLHHDGYGHGSGGQVSRCTVLATAAYFTNGTLPKEGTVCEPLFPPFEQSKLANLTKAGQ